MVFGRFNVSYVKKHTSFRCCLVIGHWLRARLFLRFFFFFFCVFLLYCTGCLCMCISSTLTPDMCGTLGETCTRWHALCSFGPSGAHSSSEQMRTRDTHVQMQMNIQIFIFLCTLLRSQSARLFCCVGSQCLTAHRPSCNKWFAFRAPHPIFAGEWLTVT